MVKNVTCNRPLILNQCKECMDKVLDPVIIITDNQAMSLNPLSQTVEMNDDETFNSYR